MKLWVEALTNLASGSGREFNWGVNALTNLAAGQGGNSTGGLTL